jgi:hypothetical protein
MIILFCELNFKQKQTLTQKKKKTTIRSESTLLALSTDLTASESISRLALSLAF